MKVERFQRLKNNSTDLKSQIFITAWSTTSGYEGLI